MKFNNYRADESPLEALHPEIFGDLVPRLYAAGVLK
jgi:hypothetical protein